MSYYTLGKKVSQVYGHGDYGEELHICPIDAYHNPNAGFHPLFKTKDECESYRQTIKWNHDLIIVELKVN